MFFGVHVSIAARLRQGSGGQGGVQNAPQNAATIGCEVFQIFSRSPRGGPAPKLTAEVIKQFKVAMEENKLAEAYIHTPYYINLASTNQRIRNGSIEVIRQELERASLLGIPYVMTHLGSANNLPRNKAVKKVIESIKKILSGYKGSAMFLIENSAGSGNIIGDTFEEIHEILKSVEKNAGVCFDTCHAFASGYDLRDKKLVNQVINKFDKIIGLDKLKLIHLNDSKTDLGAHVDRHEHIGQGKIGKLGFKEFINHPKLKKVNMILETPIDEHGGQEDDLKVIKKMRNNK